jgi:hypothetical protein
MADHIKTATDVTAFGAAFASFCGLFQPVVAMIASLLSILWLCIQIRDYCRKHKGGA